MKDRLKVYLVLISAIFLISYIVSEYYAKKVDAEVAIYKQRVSILYNAHEVIYNLTAIQEELYSIEYGTFGTSDPIKSNIKKLKQGLEGITQGMSYIFYAGRDDELFRTYAHYVEAIEGLYPNFINKVNAIMMSGNEQERHRYFGEAIEISERIEVFVRGLDKFLDEEHVKITGSLPTITENIRWIRNVTGLLFFITIVIASLIMFYSCRPFKKLLPLFRAIKEGNYNLKMEMDSIPCGREMLSAINTIAERVKEAERLTSSLTIVDPLTGAYNRRYFDIRINEEMSRCIRYGTIFSLSLIDIDHFKEVNDTLGHQVGDSILKELVIVIQENVRETDIVARYGGEEFVIIYPCTPKSGVLTQVERLRGMVEGHKFTGLNKPLTISIGVADSAGKKASELVIQEADSNLYMAKNSGRNRCVVGGVTA